VLPVEGGCDLAADSKISGHRLETHVLGVPRAKPHRAWRVEAEAAF
jgi:hypothetical protein